MEDTALNEMFKNELLSKCSNFSNPYFMGFPDAGNSISGMMGALWADLLQQNLINESFCSPIATKMEIKTIIALKKMIGYKINSNITNVTEVGGIITYGGTGSNTTAMLLARENKDNSIFENGVKGNKNLKVLIPKGIGHYSIASSLKWIGCGNVIIEVETKGFRYNIDALKRVLDEEKGNIMAVVVYAGDSRTMTIEHLQEVYSVTKESDSSIWCHADACHGFSLAFSKKYSDKIKGIEMYDSISCDPHKVFALPYCCSALLLKEPEKMNLIISKSDLIMNEPLAFGRVTPFIGSKSWVSLKLWFFMKSMGTDAIGEMVETRIENAQYFASKVRNNKNFVLLNEVDYNSVVFLFVGDRTDEKTINAINKKIYEELKADGKYYVHQFPITDDIGKVEKNTELNVLRYMSGNNNLTHEMIDEVILWIASKGRELENNENH